MKISKSKTFKEEYCATIVQIGTTSSIEGRDHIVKTLVNGQTIVVGKDEFKEGDVAVYCSNETCIHELFLHLNSLYEDKLLNADTEKKGYINKHGRIRVVKLGGVPSYGILLNSSAIATFVNEPVDTVVSYLKQNVGTDFDEINGEMFVHVYVPQISNGHGKQLSKSERLKKKLDRFKMLIEGSFRFHYDTQMWAKNVQHFNPKDVFDISVKIHGTSAIFANILTNMPTNRFKRIWRKYVVHCTEYDQKYNIVYSSRTVIKNEYINKKQDPGGYYSDDVWGHWARRLEGLIPEDYCIYGEIVGYTPKGSAIQKSYDYGCTGYQSKLMVYRITSDGKELEISEVVDFGKRLQKVLGNDIMLFTQVYHGSLEDLYPSLDTNSEHWHEDLLEQMKVDKRFNIEGDEPLCKNKVPREGIVLRKCNDEIPEAFKLKGDRFYGREAKLIDAGEVDMEMSESC